MIKSDPLIDRLCRWDESALAEVYDRYAPAIYRYAYRLTGRQQVAKEITSDTFYRMLNAIKNDSGPKKNVSAWLYRVAHNLVVDYYRRGPNEDTLAIDTLQLAGPDDHESNLQRMETAVYLRRALHKLTPLQQQVIALRFLEGLSSDEVAEIMGKTTGSVKALQHRALVSMKRIMEKENVKY